MHRQGGSVLLLVLFVMTVLSLVALSSAYSTGLGTRSIRNQVLKTRLELLTDSAVAIALGRLAENTNDFDHRAELWHSHLSLSHDDWGPGWGNERSFLTDYQVVDEEGKLNVLYASSEALEELGMSEEQIAGLLDWTDEDDIPRAEGAEDAYYLTQRTPYRTKNAPLETLDELLFMRGFSSRDYFGEDANRNRALDPAEDDGTASLPVDNADGILQLGWVDLLTCRGDRGLNLNTAPLAVLKTLPLSEGAAEQIVAFRAFDEASSGTLEEHAFRSDEDIEKLQGLTEADREVLSAVAVFKSTHFRIFAESVHVPTKLRHGVEVLVRLGDDGLKVLRWKRRV